MFLQVKMERENNYKDFRLAHDIDLHPKYGAGSEFGRQQRDEARRKKYGMATRKYSPYSQPWLMRAGTGKNARK
jgi:transcription initiation factor TFIIF subunit alpha